MPALSKKQQKFMGIVRSIQKGEQPASKFSKDAQDVAKDMKKKDVKKFASTKHKGLPMKKEMLGKLKEMIKQELSEYTYGVGDVVKDVNPTCPHYGAMGKVKSVNPRSVVFVVMNKGKNFKPGMKLEKSHDQMKKMNESFTPYRDVGKKTQIAGGIVNHWTRILFNELPVKHRNVNGVKKALRVIQQMYMVTDHSGVTGMYRVGKRKFMKDVVKKMDKLKESVVNEFSMKLQKSTQDMVDALLKVKSPMPKEIESALIMMAKGYGLDYVKKQVKKDPKGFYKNLKQMAAAFPEFRNKPKDYKFESVINEKVKFKTAADYFKNLDQSIGLIIRQANNLKGALAKHPIKQNINQLKAVQTMLKRALRPAFIKAEKERRVGLSLHGVDITELKKKLQDGKFKSAVEFSLIPALDTSSYDSNSFYFLDNYPKENKLRKRLVDVLYGLRNKMDKAQLENINEKKKMFPPDKMTPKQAKEYKKFIDYAKMGIEYKIDMSLFESINESKEPEVITQLRDIVKRKTNKKIKDPKTKKTMRVDMFTASAITQVYDAVKKTSHKSKFESLPLDKMAQLSFKMMK